MFAFHDSSCLLVDSLTSDYRAAPIQASLENCSSSFHSVCREASTLVRGGYSGDCFYARMHEPLSYLRSPTSGCCTPYVPGCVVVHVRLASATIISQNEGRDSCDVACYSMQSVSCKTYLSHIDGIGS
jgi:hypothetical protein